MIALIQRVRHASVTVDQTVIGKIDEGVLALIGVEKDDAERQAEKLLDKILAYRIFPDEHDRMNLSVADINGGLLLVPQFTLVADTGKGNRPGFSSGAAPEKGQHLFNYLQNQAVQRYEKVASGKFGADMQVSLLNNGPVTFWLQSS